MSGMPPWDNDQFPPAFGSVNKWRSVCVTRAPAHGKDTSDKCDNVFMLHLLKFASALVQERGSRFRGIGNVYLIGCTGIVVFGK